MYIGISGSFACMGIFTLLDFVGNVIIIFDRISVRSRIKIFGKSHKNAGTCCTGNVDRGSFYTL